MLQMKTISAEASKVKMFHKKFADHTFRKPSEKSFFPDCKLTCLISRTEIDLSQRSQDKEMI